MGKNLPLCRRTYVHKKWRNMHWFSLCPPRSPLRIQPNLMRLEILTYFVPLHSKQACRQLLLCACVYFRFEKKKHAALLNSRPCDPLPSGPSVDCAALAMWWPSLALLNPRAKTIGLREVVFALSHPLNFFPHFERRQLMILISACHFFLFSDYLQAAHQHDMPPWRRSDTDTYQVSAIQNHNSIYSNHSLGMVSPFLFQTSPSCHYWMFAVVMASQEHVPHSCFQEVVSKRVWKKERKSVCPCGDRDGYSYGWEYFLFLFVTAELILHARSRVKPAAKHGCVKSITVWQVNPKIWLHLTSWRKNRKRHWTAAVQAWYGCTTAILITGNDVTLAALPEKCYEIMLQHFFVTTY